ncbi:MAG: LysM peptidoglycan-binding domain-containing protein, partial [Chloroflexota bacterium]
MRSKTAKLISGLLVLAALLASAAFLPGAGRAATAAPALQQATQTPAPLVQPGAQTAVPTIDPADPYDRCTFLYAIQPGDTIESLGRLFNLTQDQLVTLNPLLRSAPALPGMVLCLSHQGFQGLPQTGGQPTAGPTVTAAPTWAPLPPTGWQGWPGYPGVRVVDVDPGRSVILRGVDFPPNTPFTVQMLALDVRNPSLYVLTGFVTPADGSFRQRFDIPRRLADAGRIRIRLFNAAYGISISTFFNNARGGGEPDPNCALFYVVRRGDTLAQIARRNNLSVRDLLDLNDLPDADLIFPGQLLCVQPGGGDQPDGRPDIFVESVTPSQEVTVGGMNFPLGVPINVQIGPSTGGPFYFITSFTLGANDDGGFRKTFSIPQQLRSVDSLIVRMVRTDNGRAFNAAFNNLS